MGFSNWLDSHISTGILEGLNCLIHAAKARTRGYRTNRNLITMVYLIGGNLNDDSPIENSEEPP
jgi:hypothetical protein